MISGPQSTSGVSQWMEQCAGERTKIASISRRDSCQSRLEDGPAIDENAYGAVCEMMPANENVHDCVCEGKIAGRRIPSAEEQTRGDSGQKDAHGEVRYEGAFICEPNLCLDFDGGEDLFWLSGLAEIHKEVGSLGTLTRTEGSLME